MAGEQTPMMTGSPIPLVVVFRGIAACTDVEPETVISMASGVEEPIFAVHSMLTAQDWQHIHKILVTCLRQYQDFVQRHVATCAGIFLVLDDNWHAAQHTESAAKVKFIWSKTEASYRKNLATLIATRH